MYLQKWLRIYHQVDAFVVPCRFMESKLIEAGFAADRIHLLHYPVTASYDRPASERGNFILYFGRISYEKGLDTLIKAFQNISTDVDLVLIGRDYDNEIERLTKYIRPEYSTSIHFLGFKEAEELSNWISTALFTIVPSRWYDNAPIAIYESFFHETPVLASDIGGIPEQVQEYVTGRLVAPGSASDLEEALTWMLSDRERLRQMGRAGKEFVTSQCNLQDHVARLVTLFERLLRECRE